MTVVVRELASAEDVQALESLLYEYFRFVCGEIDRLFEIHIDPEAEVERALSRAEDVLPPHGYGFVVDQDDGPAGMVFIRTAAPDTFEIKRLFVRDSLRGTGAGRALAERAIEAARSLGGRRMVLDSTKNLEDAARLYRKLGFADCDPYEASDHGMSSPLATHMIFMEKWLT